MDVNIFVCMHVFAGLLYVVFVGFYMLCFCGSIYCVCAGLHAVFVQVYMLCLCRSVCCVYACLYVVFVAVT